MLAEKQAFLEEAFRVLNRVYFNNSLPDITITIQSSKSTYGHFTLDRVWVDKDSSMNEINISGEHLARPIPNVLATLEHELIHYYCLLQGIADTSKGYRYHNKRFKVEAEKRGLHIEYVKYIGYSQTSPTDEFIKVLEENGLLDFELDEYRIGTVPPGDPDVGTVTKPKRPKTTKKYQCLKCGLTVTVGAKCDALLCCIPDYMVLVEVD